MKRAFLLILLVCSTLTFGQAQTNSMIARAGLIQKSSAPIRLSVDATEAPRKLFHARQGMLELLVNNEGSVIRYALDYHGGERYPRLERDNGKPDLRGQIIAPHANRR